MVFSFPDFWDLWKAVAVGLTGLFGVMGLLTNYKDKETGRITVWGKINLAGIIISATMGVLSQLVDIQRKTASAEDAARKAKASANVAQETVQEAGIAAENTRRIVDDLLKVAKQTQAIARQTDRSVNNSETAALAAQRAVVASLGIAKDTSKTVVTSQTALGRIERLVSPLAEPQLRFGIYSDCSENRLGICNLPKEEELSLARVSIAASMATFHRSTFTGGDVDYFGQPKVVVRRAGRWTPGTYQIVVPLEADTNRGGVTSYLDLAGKTISIRMQRLYVQWDDVHTVLLGTRDGQFVRIPMEKASPVLDEGEGFTMRYTFPKTGDPRMALSDH